jgi:hypothetical protein
MRTKEFEVPTEVMAEFADTLQEHGLNNSIQSSNEDGEIVVRIEYDTDDREAVLILSELIDDYHEENDEEEDD